MKVKSKITNRTISVLSLFLFVIGIALVGVSTYVIVTLYNQKEYLETIKNNIQGNVAIQDKYSEFHFDEYYSVYVEDGYALIGANGEDLLINFTK